MAKYIIGDIHGHTQTFKALLRQIRLSTADELYLLGDYIDRGPDSKGVFDTIFDLKNNGHTVICLKGNHEALCLEALHSDPERWQNRAGGQATLDSFNCKEVQKIPSEYLSFMASLPHYHIIEGRYILVHAGLDSLRPDNFDEAINLWTRFWADTLDYDLLGDRFVLHGHTPIPRAEAEAMAATFERTRVLNLDTGCFQGPPQSERGKGWLTAFELETRQLFFEACQD